MLTTAESTASATSPAPAARLPARPPAINGEFAAASGLELDRSAFGLGTRSQRYAAIIENGVVRQLMVEPDPLAVTVSSVDTVLNAL